MKELFLIIFFFHFVFISNIDIDIEEKGGIFNLTSGEAYNFYVPVEQMVQIYIDFRFENLSYVPFNYIDINEYSSRNGTLLNKYTIEDIKYSRTQENCDYYIYYDLENFSSTYISFSFESNSTVNSVLMVL